MRSVFDKITICNIQHIPYPNMNLRRERTLCIEVYKALNKLNPDYMNRLYDIFKPRNTARLTRKKYKLNIEIPKANQATHFWSKKPKELGLKIWNSLPYQSHYQMLERKPLYVQSLRTL